MVSNYLLLVAAAVLMFPAPARSEEWVIPRTTYYISADQQKFADFPPPPGYGSKKDKADLAAVLDWQGRRTPEDCARANSAAHAGFEEFFGDISPFPRPLPREAAAILGRVKTETDGAAANVKDIFKRPRPFLRDPALEPCLGRIGGMAYPSGHAVISRLFALMLGDLVPDMRKAYFSRAGEAGLDRVIGGAHHPSDIEAGKELADKLYRAYKKSPAFRADMKTLKGLLAEEER
ncbi:MAG: phosphatase PAP2 family protein [Elusimicrobia bacterium]|nr:phosphatase PAP2 family protein [Elusimicrobiota bacterium]